MNQNKKVAALVAGGALLYLMSELIATPAQRVVSIATGQVGVKEFGGNNRGAKVEEYLKAAGGQPGNSWCAAFVKWCLDKAGITNTINCWSPTASNSKNLVYQGGKFVKPVQPGDVFTLYGTDSTGKRRIIHTGFVVAYDAQTMKVTTVEGNTNAGGSVNGDGVYQRVRALSSIHNITRWS